MPVTPLISARSGQRSAYFGGPFTRIDDTIGQYVPSFGNGANTTFGGTNQQICMHRYPAIRWGTDNVSGYSFQWLKNGTVFGLYYPDKSAYGEDRGSLSADLASLTVSYGDDTPVSDEYYKTLTVDDTVYALGPNPLPLTGPVVTPTYVNGGITVEVGNGFEYGYLDGMAQWFRNGVAPHYTNGRYIILPDGTKKNAWYLPDEYTPPGPATNGNGYFAKMVGTTNDGTYNYTLEQPGTGYIPFLLHKWQSAAYNTGGPYTTEAFSISLSDVADDAIFQANFTAAGSSGNQYNVMGNYDKWIFVTFDAVIASVAHINDRFTATAFIFNKDMTSYERVDLSFVDSLNWASYFMDADGIEYAVGSDPADGTIIYQVGSSDPIVGAGVVHAWTATLAGHDFYFLRLGADATLVYDTYSDEWVEWSDATLETWRAQCGVNWAGGEALSNTYGSNIIVGDDTLGLLWFLDPNQPYDQSADPDAEIQQIYFPRILQGQVVMTGRQVEPCYAVWLTTDMGSPAYVGAGVKLEISDDAGATYDDMGTVGVTPSEMSPELSWYSLGQIEAPGRLFKITDDGAVARIDSFEMNDPADK